ncbi:Transposase DDE domain protein [Neochlamydia sp. TUME1]|nr:Transposase DDE domain protein [Neochlamydia sp. TUME1]
MIIAIMFHKSDYTTFKDYSMRQVIPSLQKYFPHVLSYNKFLTLMKTCLFSLFVYSQACLGECTGISFIDSTLLAVCHTRRIHSHPSF